ncbi:Nitrate reductase [NADPH] [Lecanosticta acicola]|uniref:Nitrate reductase n=1 Tax=Lecanosticta acicola TaxID=111012 RepID=A0AAI8YS80_9PEZI|nr:Nitrate reductase [NADPH] [Lecanosticta acicola]
MSLTMSLSTITHEDVKHLRRTSDLPLTPPDSDLERSDSENAERERPSGATHVDFPLPPSTTIPTNILEPDQKTPDRWLARDPRLIRLTGAHPFNVEAPLSDLYNEGFLTSPELFYVRNHGPVPQVRDEDIPDWEFTIEGMVENPMTLTVRQLMKEYDQHTYPITLACAGNRRKEQNVVRKTKGFSWGPAGVSTALFTGVIMADVLKKAKPNRGARYVSMEGADKLPNGYYGTSVKLNWVMDENRGFMLAHGMNGEVLRPDHGKPLRVVVPGQIGGRSVKWLKKLIVTAEPSDNWYHIYDNRVLPTMVSPEESAKKPEWWKDERYAIYDLGTNSAIAYPAHEEQLCVVGAPENYRVKGYAYGGGGRRVTRVEISINKGKDWRLANIEYVEDRYRDAEPQQLFGGTLDFGWRAASFCWCFWNIDIAVSELADCKDILVRAMDESMNMQPRDMYWSVLGMMNNPWYRITVAKENDYLRFEHPTQPALMPGGWMERVKKAGGNLTNGYWGEQIGGEDASEAVTEAAVEIKMTKEGVKNEITIDELRKHDGDEKPWFVVNGEVYDGTAFLEGHPGGAQSIISAAGMDTTDEFMAIHSETAKAMMPDHHIGTLDTAGAKALAGVEAQPDATAEPSATLLHPKAWKKVILHARRQVSWDTVVFTFKLEHDAQVPGLPTGKHLMVRLRDPVTREAIIRSYTPISMESKSGYLDILIKIYNKTDTREGGKMSMALDALPIGHFVDVKGPIGKFQYLGRGLCTINDAKPPRHIKTFYMICGGSGITPIFQIFRAIMQDDEDATRCVVLDGNRFLEDILLKDELDALVEAGKGRGVVHHTLTQAPDDWTGLRGRIAGPLLKQYVQRSVTEDGKGDGESMVLVCGPGPMEKSTREALKEMDWKDDEVLFF